jgi:hypothetical protein
VRSLQGGVKQMGCLMQRTPPLYKGRLGGVEGFYLPLPLLTKEGISKGLPLRRRGVCEFLLTRVGDNRRNTMCKEYSPV